MVVQKKDNKIKNYIERKKLIKKADKIQKQMKSQKSIINNMLDKLDEMDTPKGKEVIIKNPADAIKAGISFATEDRKGTGLVLQRSIGENMSLPLLKKFSPTFFMKSGEEKKEWNKQMETLRIKAPGTKTLASALSGGNQQKVVLGRWLMTEPKILLLDEPTRGIDVGAKAEIYQLINNLAKQGMAIIVVSSELPEVIGISDRIVTFCEGELTGEYLQEEATQEKLLQSATK